MGCGGSSQQPINSKAPTKNMALKAPAGLKSDVVMTLPAEAVEKSCGLALDIGSTMGKLIYRSKKEYKDGKPITEQADPSMGQVHFALFPRFDVPGMVKYLKENADLTPNEEGVVVVNSSGVGGASFKKDFEKGLDCKMEIIDEFSCFCQAFLTAEKTWKKEDLLIPHSAKIKAMNEALTAQMDAMMEKMEGQAAVQMGKIKSRNALEAEEDRPRLLVMAGSGTGIMQINKDHTFQLIDGCYAAGRTMYGLASLLTGENDFGKLIAMAEAADGKTADVWTSDLMPPKAEDEEENVYNTSADDMDVLMFAFGKGVTSRHEDMKKEDLAFSAFNLIAQAHGGTILQAARHVGATEVYVVGNTFNSEFMRDRLLITKALMETLYSLESPINFNFIKNGGCLGAVGAFINKKKEEKPAEAEQGSDTKPAEA